MNNSPASTSALGIKHIAVLFPHFAGGGAEAVAAWICHALQDGFTLHLIHLSPITLNELNAYYGTALREDRVKLYRPPEGFATRLDARGGWISLRQHLLVRFYHSLNLPEHLPISAFNEMDFGQPGVLYIHYPLFGEHLNRARNAAGFPDSIPRQIYRRALNKLFGYSQRRMLQNTLLTNSQWTANIVREAYQVLPTILYPPVVFSRERLPWEARADSVLCLGRMERDKQIDQILLTLKALRNQGVCLGLTIISAGSEDPDYEQYINQLVGENSDWASLKSKLSRSELETELVHHKYGIHGKKLEHFGIAVAELLRAGCIPFAFAEGGPAAILNGNPALLFTDWDDAVTKIKAVATSPEKQEAANMALGKQAEQYAPEAFCHHMQAIITQVLETR